MESRVVIKTEVEEGGGDTTTKWVNTKGHCFLCLERSSAMKVICLQGLLRHLQINQGDVSMVGGSAEFPAQEWDKITVDLCLPCGTRADKLNTLLRDLEKIQVEIKGLLEQTHKSISESSKHPELLGKFVEKMTKEAGTLLSLGVATNLRKELLNKVSVLVRAPNAPTEIPSATAQRAEIQVDEPVASTSTSASEEKSHNRTGLPKKRLMATNTKATTEKGSGLLTWLQNSRQGGKTGKEDSKEKTSRSAGGNMAAPEVESSLELDSPPSEVENPALPVANNAPYPGCSNSIPTELPGRRKSLQKRKPSEVGNSKEGTSYEDEAELESETSASVEEPEVPEIRGQKRAKQFYTEKSGIYHCKQCDKTCKTFSAVYYHYHVAHLKRKYKCRICNEAEFAWPSKLRKHQRTCRQKLELKQAKEKDPRFKFVCEVCGKRFDSGRRLGSHCKSTHESINRYHCEFCDKKFCSRSSVNVHKNVVHLGKLFPCKFCKKKFSSPVIRWQHHKACPKRQPNNK